VKAAADLDVWAAAAAATGEWSSIDDELEQRGEKLYNDGARGSTVTAPC
jgi:hypothetical protein